MAVRIDVHVVEPHLALLHPREAVAKIRPPLANPLHLGPEQRDPRLEGSEDVIVEERLPVLGDERLLVPHLWHLSHLRHLRHLRSPAPCWKRHAPAARRRPPPQPCFPDRRCRCRRCRTPSRDRRKCARWATRSSRSPRRRTPAA